MKRSPLFKTFNLSCNYNNRVNASMRMRVAVCDLFMLFKYLQKRCSQNGCGATSPF
jgi:hypothetical protein